MGQIKFFGALMLIALFSFAIINYAANFAIDNGSVSSILGDTTINNSRANIADSVQLSRTGVNGTMEVLSKSTISQGDETLERVGQFDGGVSGVFNSVKSIINITREKVFGGDQSTQGFGVVLTGLVSFLVLISGLYAWKTLAGRNPE